VATNRDKKLLATVADRGQKTGGKQAAVANPEWSIADDAELESKLIELLGIATIYKEFEKPGKALEATVKLGLFELWAKKMWDSRFPQNDTGETNLVPENPRVIVRVNNKKRPEDCKMVYAVKFKDDALGKRVPELGKRLPDKDAPVYIQEILISKEVGLTEENAKKFVSLVDGEIKVARRVELVSTLDKMLESKDKFVLSYARKTLKMMESAHTKYEFEPYTDEEMKAVVRTYEEIIIKEGFFSRATKYCTSLVQLQKLLLLTAPTLQIGSVEFGLNDTKDKRIARLGKLMTKYLSIQEEAVAKKD
jgi:hypothetical protein